MKERQLRPLSTRNNEDGIKKVKNLRQVEDPDQVCHRSVVDRHDIAQRGHRVCLRQAQRFVDHPHAKCHLGDVVRKLQENDNTVLLNLFPDVVKFNAFRLFLAVNSNLNRVHDRYDPNVCKACGQRKLEFYQRPRVREASFAVYEVVRANIHKVGRNRVIKLFEYVRHCVVSLEKYF